MASNTVSKIINAETHAGEQIEAAHAKAAEIIANAEILAKNKIEQELSKAKSEAMIIAEEGLKQAEKIYTERLAQTKKMTDEIEASVKGKKAAAVDSVIKMII